MEMVINRGIPGSGKSTFARLWVATGNGIRINRDDIRHQLYGVYHGPPINEDHITWTQDVMVIAALTSGISVIVDDCNIEPKYIRRFVKIAKDFGADVSIKQHNTPLETCLERNALRDRVVPEDVIRRMHKRLTEIGEINID